MIYSNFAAQITCHTNLDKSGGSENQQLTLFSLSAGEPFSNPARILYAGVFSVQILRILKGR